MREYLFTAIASLCAAGFIFVAASFGYEEEALLALFFIVLPLAFLIRYLRFGRQRSGTRDNDER